MVSSEKTEEILEKPGSRKKAVGGICLLLLFFAFSVSGIWYFAAEFERQTDPSVEASLFNQKGDYRRRGSTTGVSDSCGYRFRH